MSSIRCGQPGVGQISPGRANFASEVQRHARFGWKTAQEHIQDTLEKPPSCRSTPRSQWQVASSGQQDKELESLINMTYCWPLPSCLRKPVAHLLQLDPEKPSKPETQNPEHMQYDSDVLHNSGLQARTILQKMLRRMCKSASTIT